jgi:sterol desaturase/sphingolipid hydroxylase (fatty acid hydroxylase superfamily)
MMIPGIVAFLLATLERFTKIRFKASPLFRRHFASDVIYLLTGFVAGGSLGAAYVLGASGWVGDYLLLPRLAAHGPPLWLSTLLALVMLDFGNYFAHYLLHRSSLLWEFHKIHHSSRTLDWLATFRSHIIEQVLRRLVAPALLILAGFPLKAVTLAGGLFIAWAIFNHSNLKLNLRFLESIFITPRLHRLHHLSETENRNLGTIFTFWDRLRGTFVIADTGEDSVFGIAGEIETYPQDWASQLIEPPKRIARAIFTPSVNPTRLN